MKIKHKFGIRIRSVYTGEEITLGSQYNSYKEAEKQAEKQVCSRCNGFEIITLPEDAIWKNKIEGFVSIKDKRNRIKEHNENKNEMSKVQS